MTGGEGCGDLRRALGVYVVGAIDPAERARVDAHLAGCPECREVLAELAGLPALLHRIPVGEARRLAAGDGPPPQAPPPGELLGSLLARVAAARRARRWRTAAAAAAVAVLALGAGAAGAAALGGSPPPARVAAGGTAGTVSGAAAGSPVHLTVKYQRMTWGTRLSVRVTGVPEGTVCQFRVTGVAGRTAVLGGWRVSYAGERTWYPLSTAMSEGSLRSFQVLGNGKVLVSVAAR